VPTDKQAHFFVSAKLLRLTDLGKTAYGTAMIGAEEVRYRGMVKELADIGLTDREIAANLLTQIAHEKLKTICMLDDLILQESIDDDSISSRLADLVKTFEPIKRARLVASRSWNVKTGYGKALMQWYAEQEAWFEEELSKRGLDAAALAKHPIVDAFRILIKLTRAEDRMVAALKLDESDLLYDFGGITSGMSENFARRATTFKQALDARGEPVGVSMPEFYDRFLRNDVFTQATRDLPDGIAQGTISTHSLTHRYVVSSNLPQEPHTILANDQMKITYHPMKDEPWMGVITTVVKVPPATAMQLARNLYDPSAQDPVHPAGQKEAMTHVYASVHEIYSDAVRKSGILSQKMELAQAQR
jgi:hypothetical protein